MTRQGVDLHLNILIERAPGSRGPVSSSERERTVLALVDHLLDTYNDDDSIVAVWWRDNGHDEPALIYDKGVDHAPA